MIGALLNNRYVAGLAAAGAVIAGFLLWLAGHDRRVIANHDAHIKRKSTEALLGTKEDNDEALEKARVTRRNAARGIASAGELSDDQRGRFIRD